MDIAAALGTLFLPPPAVALFDPGSIAIFPRFLLDRCHPLRICLSHGALRMDALDGVRGFSADGTNSSTVNRQNNRRFSVFIAHFSIANQQQI
jgi:hypothetical protein